MLLKGVVQRTRYEDLFRASQPNERKALQRLVVYEPSGTTVFIQSRYQAKRFSPISTARGHSLSQLQSKLEFKVLVLPV